MPVKTVRLYTIALIISDILAVLGAFSIAYIVRVQLDPRPLIAQISAFDFFTTFLLLVPFWILTFVSLGLYSPSVYQKRLTEYGKLFMGSFIGILLVIGLAFVLDQEFFPARLVAVYALVLTFLLLLLGREILRGIRGLLYWFGVGVQRVMVIGSTDITADIILNLGNTQRSGYRVVASVDGNPSDKSITVYKSLEKALEDLDELHIDTVIQTELYQKTELNQAIMNATQSHHIQYCFIPGETEFYSGKNQIDVFLGYPIINVYQTPLIGWGEVAKRIFDLFLTIITLPLWGTLLVLVTIIQSIVNPGPVLYRSKRLTQYSREFNLLKFRSMGAEYGKNDAADEFREMGRVDLAEEYEKTRKVVNDPRITKFGAFLRATSLDELPQLINVLRGDLSLVGPRPILPQEVRYIQSRGALLHSVKSGLTGLWQVSGRSELSFEKRVELELYYAQNWSFWLDIKILFKTIAVVLFRTGAR
jgi:exopolysaccharide biosynthesis polyprenyl glycosylphosphotransferase